MSESRRVSSAPMKPEAKHISEDGGLRARFIAEWRFLSLVGTLALFLVSTWLRFDAVEAEVSRQSVVDSVSASDRWVLSVGQTFSACWQRADTLENFGLRRIARRSCEDILVFAPKLRRGEIPDPPAPRVWRPRVLNDGIMPLLGGFSR